MGIDITGLSRQFYVTDYFLFRNMQGTGSLLFDRFMKKRLFKLKDSHEEFCDGFAKLLKEYLTTICIGEFRYAKSECNIYLKHFFGTDADRERIYTDAKDIYDVDLLLPVIEKIFRYFFWRNSIGGKNWANIAHAVTLHGKVPNTVFIDHCMDLFHNGNSCYDKPYIFDYCACYNKFLNFKKNTTEILCPEFDIHTRETCPQHNQFLDFSYKNLEGVVVLNQYLSKYLSSKYKIIKNWEHLVSNSTRKGNGHLKIDFNPEHWVAKTPAAARILREIGEGKEPRPFNFNEEAENLRRYKRGQLVLEITNKNIFAEKFSFSVFKINTGFKVGDMVKATSKSYNPHNFLNFLENYCPDGVFQIVHISEDDLSGKTVYHAIKKGKWLFYEEDLTMFDMPKSYQEDEEELDDNNCDYDDPSIEPENQPISTEEILKGEIKPNSKGVENYVNVR